MTPRHLYAAALVAVLLAGSACGDDPEPADGPAVTTTTTTEVERTTTPPPTDDAATEGGASTGEAGTDPAGPDTGAPATAFAHGASQVRTMLDAATTACDLVAISEYTATLEDPSGPAEVRQMVELQVELLRAIADTAPAEFAEQAGVVREVAGSLLAEAEAVGFDLAAVQSLDSVQSERFQTAFFSFYEDTADNC